MGFSNISPYVVGWSGRAASFIVFTHSSPTSKVSYLFRKKLVNVCAMSLGDVIMRPCSSFILRMVLSALLCCIRRMLYMVGCSPPSLSASSSMRIVFSLLLWSITIFAFRRFSVGCLRRWCQYDVTHHIYIHNSNSPCFSGLGVAPLAPFGRTAGISSYNINPTTCLCPGGVVPAFAVAPNVFVLPPYIGSRWEWYYLVSIFLGPSVGWVHQCLVADTQLGGQ